MCLIPNSNRWTQNNTYFLTNCHVCLVKMTSFKMLTLTYGMTVYLRKNDFIISSLFMPTTKKCFFYAIVCFYRFYSPWINLRVFSQKWVPPFRAPKIDDVTIFRHYYYYILLVYISSFPSIYNSNVYLVGPLNSKTRALFWISPLYY